MEFDSEYLSKFIPQPTKQVDNTIYFVIILCAVILVILIVIILLLYKKKNDPVNQPKQKKPPKQVKIAKDVESIKYTPPNIGGNNNNDADVVEEDIDSNYDYTDVLQEESPKIDDIPDVVPPIIESRRNAIENAIDNRMDPNVFVDDGESVRIPQYLSRKITALNDARYSAFTLSEIPLQQLVEILEHCDNEDILTWSRKPKIANMIQKFCDTK